MVSLFGMHYQVSVTYFDVVWRGGGCLRVLQYVVAVDFKGGTDLFLLSGGCRMHKDSSTVIDKAG